TIYIPVSGAAAGIYLLTIRSRNLFSQKKFMIVQYLFLKHDPFAFLPAFLFCFFFQQIFNGIVNGIELYIVFTKTVVEFRQLMLYFFALGGYLFKSNKGPYYGNIHFNGALTL